MCDERVGLCEPYIRYGSHYRCLHSRVGSSAALVKGRAAARRAPPVFDIRLCRRHILDTASQPRLRHQTKPHHRAAICTVSPRYPLRLGLKLMSL